MKIILFDVLPPALLSAFAAAAFSWFTSLSKLSHTVAVVVNMYCWWWTNNISKLHEFSKSYVNVARVHIYVYCGDGGHVKE